MVLFLLFFEDFFQYFRDLVELLPHTENNCYHCFVGLIVTFLLLIESLGMIHHD